MSKTESERYSAPTVGKLQKGKFRPGSATDSKSQWTTITTDETQAYVPTKHSLKRVMEKPSQLSHRTPISDSSSSCQVSTIETVSSNDSQMIVEGKLREELRSINAELSYYRNQNQFLKKEISKIKKVVKEVGGNLDDMARNGSKRNWLGHEEVVLSLKEKLRHLSDQLLQKEDVAFDKPAEENKCSPVLWKGEKVIEGQNSWRLQYEREHVFQNARREQQIWLNDYEKLKEKLEPLLERNTDLTAEVSLLRDHISKSKEAANSGIITRLNEMEIKMESYLEDKGQLKSALDQEDKQMDLKMKEIADLKAEIRFQKTLLKDNEDQLEALKKNHGKLHSSLHEIKPERLANCNKLRQELGEMGEAFLRKTKRLEPLVLKVDSFERYKVEPIVSPYSVPEKRNRSTDSLKCLKSIEEQVVQVQETKFPSTEGSDLEWQRNDLEEKSMNLKSCFQVLSNKNRAQSHHIYDVIDSIGGKTAKLLESQSYLWQLTGTIEILKLRCKNLQQLSLKSGPDAEEDNQGFYSSSYEFLDEGNMLLEILRSDNTFLKEFIRMAITNRANAFNICDTYLCKRIQMYLMDNEK